MSKPARTITITVDGATFTTRTVRNVTHAVVAVPSALDVAECAEWAAKNGSDWWKRAYAERKAAHDARRPYYITWCSRADLAAKQARRDAANRRLTDVQIVAIPPIDAGFQAQMDRLVK